MNTTNLPYMTRYFSLYFAVLSLVFLANSCSNVHDHNSQVMIELGYNWQFRQAGSDQWLPASVPGTVHTDLLDNQIIGDPYYRLNEKSLQWIDKKDWEYRTILQIDPKVLKKEKQELVFEGLDTYAKVYLDGDLILLADNMFRTWIVDVKGKLKPGKNELLILLESPTGNGLQALKEYGFQLAADNDQSEAGEMGADRVSPYVRKAPYHFGWDWGPRLVTSGIWRPVWLRAWNTAHIDDVHIVTDRISDVQADMVAHITVVILKPGKYYFILKRAGVPGGGVPRDSTPFELIAGMHELKVPFSITNPEKWFPNGSGEQKIYEITLELLDQEKLLDGKTIKVGLRDVKLVQQPDPDSTGKSFYFEVNGKPVFAKGANYIPNDVFLNRVSPEKYEFIVKSAADANLNMLRVWGGGVYENDLFYDLCDQYGIMVWQDFMFACAMYPGDVDFLGNVRREAIDNVKRLRNHPCLVLWCGNNEIEAAWGPYEENRGWGWKQRYTAEQRQTIWKAYDTLFHHILPEVVKLEDPGRPYWHSSPSAGMGQLASYESTSGDMHYWGVWHGLHPFTDFSKYKARFMSEYGFQSFPEFNSVKKYTLTEDHNIESDVMMAHQRSGIGNLRIKQYMTEDYDIPEDFEQFLYVGQLLQAEAIKLAIESHRAEMPYCMGSLYWQLNDCWPVASWSGIDYYGKWKALHYFVREAFKPSILVVSEGNDSLKFKLVSDDDEIGKFKLEIRLLDFSGNVEWQAIQEIEMASHRNTFSQKEILGKADPASVVLISELKKDEEIIDRDIHYFVKPKELKLKDPQIKSELKEIDDKFVISLSATFLAKNVFLYADGLEEHFSDNFFDVFPGETVRVSIPKNEITKGNLKSFKMVHLFMTENP